MEDDGNDHVNYLLCNSFFQEAETDALGGITKFKMHDLVFDLANSLSRVDIVTVGFKDLKNSSDALHLRLYTNGEIEHLSFVDEDDVVEGLRSHPNLKQLSIENFGGDNLPRWMMSGCEFSITNLVLLNLEKCQRLEHVPPLGQLPSLKILCLKGTKRMKSLGSDFYHGDGSNSTQASLTTTAFPSLEELSLQSLPSLEEWMEPQGSFPSFPCLEWIFVEDCPKLVTMPSRFPSLKILHIIRSNGILLRLVVEVLSLIELYIIEVSEVKFLPKGILDNNIKELHIENCPNLEAIIMPSEESLLQVLPSSLEMLLVSQCPSLVSFPDLRGLHSIRNFCFPRNEKITRLPEGLHTLHTLELLSIGGFSSELESFPDLEPLQRLSSLRNLHIFGWSKLTSPPEQLQSLTQLESLGINKFHSVTTLPEWLENLSLLRILSLEECNNLMYLPKVEGMRCFTALRKLTIRNCSILKERCSRGRGEEWPKIKHIQNIQIDCQYV
ncbi:putative disease resistance protein RGA3 [Macadamia integrifolia]|uniref:putative disease resistance protein RGA3 n=1 Tax=Macadamia integrifolia TaxID=60698 RepID=UPI001C4EE306|nr:putative disease resistance protein RGA3 [Macadamia integrifolia]